MCPDYEGRGGLISGLISLGKGEGHAVWGRGMLPDQNTHVFIIVVDQKELLEVIVPVLPLHQQAHAAVVRATHVAVPLHCVNHLHSCWLGKRGVAGGGAREIHGKQHTGVAKFLK